MKEGPLNMSRQITLFLFILLTSTLTAQDFSRHNWYFGNSSRAIRFSRTDNSPSLVSKTPLGMGGTGTVTDPSTANHLFYADANTIYDITHAVMSNGGGLTGNTMGNQPVAICPVPGQAQQYYVFTNTASFTGGGNIVYSIVDMTQFGNAVFPSPPIGAVTSKNQGIGLTGRSEAMITVPHSNGTDYWLITHQNGTDIYNATQIMAGGAFNTVTISGVTGIPIVAGNFAYHEATGKIAVTPQDINRDIAILNFDPSNGGLTMDQFVVNSASIVAQDIYDTEWSPSGQYLYISRNNDVLQYDTSNPLNSFASVLPGTVFKSYGLQIAPDTAIYHLYESSSGVFNLGRITDADSVAANVIYTADAFGGNLDFDAKQFPAFSATVPIVPAVTFTTSGTCQNSPIAFYPTVSPTADSLVWDFGDGASSSAWSPVHLYQNSGSVTVNVTPYLNGVPGTPASMPLTLTAFTLQISLVQDTTACQCEFPPPVGTSCNGGFSVTATINGGSPVSQIWSNGDMGPTLTPDSAGYYYLVVTDASGCSAYAGVNVREYDAIDQRANIWYFGQNAGIDFNEIPPLAISGPINSPEGVSVISDRNGDVIFSTDGVRVYDRNNNEIPIPVPPGIGGSNGSSQSALIVPVPGDETLYYIFTTQEVDQGQYELRYSLYDIKLNNGDGGLAEYNQLLFTPSTERITSNGNWLIAHEFGNNCFRAYPITSMGIGNPVISCLGSEHSFTPFENGQGYMKINGNTLAVAYSIPGVSNTIEFFDFSDSTGVVSNYRSADTKQTAGQIYGIEFGANKIFATITGSSSSTLVEFYLDSLGNPHLIEPSLAAIPEQLGAIQISPSGQLFIAVNGKPYLASINVNGDTTMVSTVTLVGFPLTGTSTMGLPNFVQNVGTGPQLAAMTVDGLCLGLPTDFFGSGTDPIDVFFWSFGDGFSSSNQVDQHTYAAAADYIVTLNVTNRCGLDTTLTRTITISPPPANPTFLPLGIPQPVICNGPLTLEATPATNPDLPNLSFLWTNGEITRTILVDQQQILGVQITNTAGCTSYDEILVADNRPQFDLGLDQTLCQNSPVTPLDAQNPGAVYAWEINNTPSGTSQTQSVATGLPGTFLYEVTVTDPITNCTVQDDVTFTIKESPLFTALPGNTTSCGSATGQIDLTINSPAGTLFSYFITGPGASLQGIDQVVGPVTGSPFGGLIAGTYGVTVQDQVSQCYTIALVPISDNVIDILSVAPQPPLVCDPEPLDVVTTGIIFPTTATYTIFDNTNPGVPVVPATPFTTANFATTGVPVPGDYTIQVDAQGCVATEPITLVSDPQVVLSLAADGCADPVTVTATGGDSWLWSQAPGITSSNTLPTITALPDQGPQQYKVTAFQAGLCPTTDSITVVVNNNAVADFIQSDECANTITLTASITPAGTYTYRWYRDGVLIPGGSTIQAGLSDNGINYNVEAVNTTSGCLFASSLKPVNVSGLMQITMLPPAPYPCEGDQFTLTATSSLPGPNYEWFRDNVSVGTNDTYQDTRSGLYRVVAFVVPQCPAEAENLISPFPLPPKNLPTRDLICNDPGNPDPDSREIILDAGAGYLSYAWYKDGVLLSGETSQTYVATEPGTYTSEIENSYGCFGTDDILLEEECNPRIIAPTAFRPGSQIVGMDGDLANNAFKVFSFFIEEDQFEVFIYNRWGEMVYQDDSPDFRWNGHYNNSGALLPAGTYTYVIRYVSKFRPQDGTQEQRGGVVLVR